MKKILSFPLLFSLSCLLGISFFSTSPAMAQIFRPPVPAAQAQDEDDNANTSFNDAVSAQGGMGSRPPQASQSSNGFNPAEPGVTASFSQGSTGNDLPPPNAPSGAPAAETPQEQATAQAVRQPQMQKQNIGPARYQGSVSSPDLNPAANAGT